MAAHEKNGTPPSTCSLEAVSSPHRDTQVAPRFASVSGDAGAPTLMYVPVQEIAHISKEASKRLSTYLHY